jgi:hypothetical protein
MRPYPSGCYTQAASNVGWYPCRLTGDTNLFVGPDEAFHAKRVLRAGMHVGRQSVRNPDARADPPMRGGRDGFAWVYVRKGGDAGWVPERLLESDAGGWAHGPAGVDFEVSTTGDVAHAPRVKKQPRFRLGWPASGERIVQGRDVYLRFAPHGTAFHYLQDGDRVTRRWRHPRGYVCVRVIESQTVPTGTTGWVYGRGLRKL